jgi:antibiotic biosynthesis monooxygenase (ABM) superfamily enzyme
MEIFMSPNSATATTAIRPGPALPPLSVRLRLALLTLLAVYPFITAMLYVVFPLTDGWPLYARTLVVAPLMVVAMMFVIMPLLQRSFGRFIATGKF